MISNAECVHVMKDKVARQNVHLSCMHRALGSTPGPTWFRHNDIPLLP